MANLEKRIAALETAGAVGVKPITNIVRFVKPGADATEIQALHTDQDAQSWIRLDGESESELIDRATREAERTAWGVALLFVARAD